MNVHPPRSSWHPSIVKRAAQLNPSAKVGSSCCLVVQTASLRAQHVPTTRIKIYGLTANKLARSNQTVRSTSTTAAPPKVQSVNASAALQTHSSCSNLTARQHARKRSNLARMLATLTMLLASAFATVPRRVLGLPASLTTTLLATATEWPNLMGRAFVMVLKPASGHAA